MPAPVHHLAQANVAVLRAPLDSPTLQGFVDALDPINALADGAPGFVWRLQTEDGDATAIRVFDDDRMLVNLSVWESLDALGEFVYRSAHTHVMRRRSQWFHRMASAHLVLWWMPAGQLPSAFDVPDRLAHLAAHGPTAHAFTFGQAYPPPWSPSPDVGADDRWACPAG